MKTIKSYKGSKRYIILSFASIIQTCVERWHHAIIIILLKAKLYWHASSYCIFITSMETIEHLQSDLVTVSFNWKPATMQVMKLKSVFIIFNTPHPQVTLPIPMKHHPSKEEGWSAKKFVFPPILSLTFPQFCFYVWFYVFMLCLKC